MPTGAPDITAIVAFFKRLNGSILLHFQGRGVPLLTRHDDRYECDFFFTILIRFLLITHLYPVIYPVTKLSVRQY